MIKKLKRIAELKPEILSVEYADKNFMDLIIKRKNETFGPLTFSGHHKKLTDWLIIGALIEDITKQLPEVDFHFDANNQTTKFIHRTHASTSVNANASTLLESVIDCWLEINEPETQHKLLSQISKKR